MAPEERFWHPRSGFVGHFLLCRIKIKNIVGNGLIYCFVSYFSTSDDFFHFGIKKPEMVAKITYRGPQLGYKGGRDHNLVPGLHSYRLGPAWSVISLYTEDFGLVIYILLC